MVPHSTGKDAFYMNLAPRFEAGTAKWGSMLCPRPLIVTVCYNIPTPFSSLSWASSMLVSHQIEVSHLDAGYLHEYDKRISLLAGIRTRSSWTERETDHFAPPPPPLCWLQEVSLGWLKSQLIRKLESALRGKKLTYIFCSRGKL